MGDSSDVDWARKYVADVEVTYEDWGGSGPTPSMTVMYEALRRRLEAGRCEGRNEGRREVLGLIYKAMAIVREAYGTTDSWFIALRSVTEAVYDKWPHLKGRTE